jgi:SAM-dependent methyltransferase
MSDIDYVLGHSDSEQERLLQQAGTFAADASWLLDRAGVGPGGRVADIGCGPLGIIDLLAAGVGGRGHVVGVDADTRMIVRAQELVSQQGLGNVSLMLAEATDTGLDRSSFDLAHARLLLLHAPHPEQVVAELAALTRPGGTVALQESDWVSWVCQPPHPAWDRLQAALTAFARRRGLDLFVGRRLPELLRGAGLEDVSFRAVCPTYFTGQHDNHTLLIALARQFHAGLVDDGLLTAAELDDLIGQLGQHLAQPGTMTIYWLLCQAWARKPLD